MDYTLPFELEVAPPPGDTTRSAVGPVSSYAVVADEEGGKLLVELEQRFSRAPGSGIARNMGGISVDRENWPEWAAELILDAVDRVSEHPALTAAFALLLDRPKLVTWDADTRMAVLQWPDERVRLAAIAHLRGTG